MTPSKGFVESLQRLDPLLRVRWGAHAGAWVIERKSHLSHEEVKFLGKRFERLRRIINNPFHEQHNSMRDMYRGVAEEYTAALDSHRVVMVVHELTDKTYNMLCASDLQRYGGYSRYADELEQAESRRKSDAQRVTNNEWEAVHKETFDMLKHVWEKQSTKLDNGEKDLFYLLHGRRRTESDNAPIIKSLLTV